MEPKHLLLGAGLALLLGYFLYRWVASDSTKPLLNSVTSAQQMTTIAPSALVAATGGASTSNFTYSIWFFINDWNYRYGEPKVLFGRMSSPPTGTGTPPEPCPSLMFGPVQNNLLIDLAVFPGLDIVPVGTSVPTSVVHHCHVSDVPIQRWCNVLISTYGRTLDVYLDGKLVRTSVMPGVAKMDATASVYVTPMGGFSGWTSKLQYWPTSSDSQQAWTVYRAGYGGSLLGNTLGQYQVKIALMNGDVATSSVTL
jgi:hypothetical protein